MLEASVSSGRDPSAMLATCRQAGGAGRAPRCCVLTRGGCRGVALLRRPGPGPSGGWRGLGWEGTGGGKEGACTSPPMSLSFSRCRRIGQARQGGPAVQAYQGGRGHRAEAGGTAGAGKVPVCGSVMAEQAQGSRGPTTTHKTHPTQPNDLTSTNTQKNPTPATTN